MIDEKRLTEIEEWAKGFVLCTDSRAMVKELITALREKNACAELGAMVRRMPDGWCLQLTHGLWAVFVSETNKVLSTADTPEEVIRLALAKVEGK
jgi:hypothetical protein